MPGAPVRELPSLRLAMVPFQIAGWGSPVPAAKNYIA
jgi:hypothetical protein